MFNTQLELLEEIAGRYPDNGVVVMMYTPKLGFVYAFADDNEDSDEVSDAFIIYNDKDKWFLNDTDKGKLSAIFHLEAIKLITESIDFEDDDVFENGLDLD